jgi:hypothetical protein
MTKLLGEKAVVVVDGDAVRVDHDVRSEVDALFREARRRRRRRWAIGCGAVAISTSLGVFAGVSFLRPGRPSRVAPSGATPSGATPSGAIIRTAPPAPATNLDILSGSLQLRIRLGARAGKSSSVPATPGVAPPLALAREGYLIGIAMGRYESVSDDLRTVAYRWPSGDGQYPAPASNPADVWLTGPGGDPSRAEEFDGRGQPVASPVPIPPGMVVLGEVGDSLVLQGPAPAQDLGVWDSQEQRFLATLGPWDQEATSGSMLAWTAGSVLRVATRTGFVVQTADGPSGDWATSLAISPDGRRIAVVWAPRPGSPGATTRSAQAERSTVDLVAMASGASRPVPGSRGATGPVAWSPDGSHIFFGQTPGTGSSAAVAAYGLGTPRAEPLRPSGVSLPAGFGPATGALVTWRTP